jgi:hypothetical protein
MRVGKKEQIIYLRKLRKIQIALLKFLKKEKEGANLIKILKKLKLNSNLASKYLKKN